LCRKAGIPFAPPTEQSGDFWRDQAPELLLQAIEVMPQAGRFDAVVVDEGQDFLPAWWIPLIAINARDDKGPLFIFYDPAQNLFGAEAGSLPTLGSPFRLPTNCRNTRTIARTCGEIIGQGIPTRADAPEGQAVRYLVAGSRDEQKAAVGKVLDEWIRVGGLRPSRVVILCPFRQERSSLAGVSVVNKFPLTSDLEEWKRGDAVLFSTVRAFKGLEADAIVIMDVPADVTPDSFPTADWYVACSRAKHLLTVIRREKS
jgi:superfamily I DNA/RNA helicase